MFSKTCFEVVIAENGSMAVQAIMRSFYVIIPDIQMPAMEARKCLAFAAGKAKDAVI